MDVKQAYVRGCGQWHSLPEACEGNGRTGEHVAQQWEYCLLTISHTARSEQQPQNVHKLEYQGDTTQERFLNDAQLERIFGVLGANEWELVTALSATLSAAQTALHKETFYFKRTPTGK